MRRINMQRESFRNILQVGLQASLNPSLYRQKVSKNNKKIYRSIMSIWISELRATTVFTNSGVSPFSKWLRAISWLGNTRLANESLELKELFSINRSNMKALSTVPRFLWLCADQNICLRPQTHIFQNTEPNSTKQNPNQPPSPKEPRIRPYKLLFRSAWRHISN